MNNNKTTSADEIEVSRYKEELGFLILENENLLNEKMRAENFSHMKSVFLANMSHELRTPMHAILSFSKLSLKKLGVLERNQLISNLEIIYQNGQRLLHTLNDILDISKLEAGQMDFEFEKSNLKLEAEAVIRELQSLFLDQNITYKLDLTAADCVADFDRHRIGQVLQNILGNAIKFSPEGGVVKVIAQKAILHGKDAIELTISDQGVGIPEDELEIIFDKYVQSSRKTTQVSGTGLGLSISKKIIAAHSGKIWAARGQKIGSKFHFIIPTTQEKKHAEQTI